MKIEIELTADQAAVITELASKEIERIKLDIETGIGFGIKAGEVDGRIHYLKEKFSDMDELKNIRETFREITQNLD